MEEFPNQEHDNPEGQRYCSYAGSNWLRPHACDHHVLLSARANIMAILELGTFFPPLLIQPRLGSFAGRLGLLFVLLLPYCCHNPRSRQAESAFYLQNPG
jgi:hypothetical protein